MVSSHVLLFCGPSLVICLDSVRDGAEGMVNRQLSENQEAGIRNSVLESPVSCAQILEKNTKKVVERWKGGGELQLVVHSS